MGDCRCADDIIPADLDKYIARKRGSDIVADAIIYHGDCYYAPVEAEGQGIGRTWTLMEHRDLLLLLLLRRRLVNIAAVLRGAL
mgnify:CR=1 FL=1